ncbi:MAG: hypothetical protein OEW58_09975 [Gammaproteobacteria bacterium]|nr:hypothetical protein [Gammaproteobacteria bacterium]
MDEAFRTNLHFFMIGLGVVCIAAVVAIIAFYLRLKANVKKQKQQ